MLGKKHPRDTPNTDIVETEAGGGQNLKTVQRRFAPLGAHCLQKHPGRATPRTPHQLDLTATASMRCLRTRCAPALLALALVAPASAQQLQPQCTAAQVEEAAFAVAAACGINLHGKIPSASPDALPLPAECSADCPGPPGAVKRPWRFP